MVKFMQNSVTLRARAKINIALDVTARRGDGYHDIDTVMQTVELSDVIYLKKVEKNSDYIKVVCDAPFLPPDERNLVYKAIAAVKAAFGVECGVFAEITKKIPVSAGLGGGSADCAATLVGLRKLFKLAATDGDLRQIGASLGADVPFCLMGGTVRATGIGERLTRLNPFPRSYALIIRPPIAVSTESVFKRFDDLAENAEKPDITRLVSAMNDSDIKTIAAQMKNALEIVTERDYPVIADIKKFLSSNGAFAALMSGSGASVFGLFLSRRDAVAAYNAAKNAYKEYKDIFLTTTCD